MESPVAAGGPRNTSVIVLTLDTNEVYIVVSLSARTDTQVIYVDPTTGSLQHKRKPGYDVFNSQDEALNYITDGSNLTCKSTTYAKAILGYAVLGSFALLLVATKLTASIPYLPGGGCVYTISESKWIKVLLQNPQPQGKGEAKNIQELMEFEIDGKHYFCETRDITRPFPSRISVQSPDHEFVWNGCFSTAFKRIGLEQHCVILLQGFVEYRTFGSLGQQEGIVALIARRSRLHPGTRYLARGLNSCYSTGNEIECEQLVWVPKRAGQSVPFNTYVWRRGTIPIWWGADLKMTAAEAVIYVSDRDPYKGSARYYQRLSTRYDARNLGVAGSNQNKGGFVPIVCVNLLRNGEGKSESVLVQHFEESLNHIRSTRKLPSTRLQLVNYDWHTSIRLKGEQQTIEGLWYHLKGPTISIGISEGDYLPSRQNMKDFQGEVVYNDDLVGFFCLRVHQNGVIRYNCADSLDRTNAASYFGSLQVFTEQCRRLGICLDSDLVAGRQSPNNRSSPTSPFSPGSKRQSTGAPNYTDLILKNSSGKHLYLDKPWKHFDMTFEEFKRSTVLSPVCQLADLFLIAGDIHATIYTGSKAMHSHILNIFSDEAGKSKQFAVAQNVKITLQRRYNNAVVDGYRQKQLEMFLGLRLFKHLPSVSIQPLHVLSRRSGCLLKPIASIEESSGDGDCLLSFRQKDIIWVSQQAADIIQLFIYLREPCHVCQLLLTISHGADDSTYPSTLDVRTGRDLDVLKLVVEGASIPRCASGTNLVIPLSGPIGDKDMALTGTAASLPGHKSKFSFLYNFDGVEGELDFLTRVVVVTFYPAESTCSPVTLGEVEILGVSLPWRDMFASEEPGQRLWENVNNMREDGNFFPSDTDSTPSVVALTSNKLPNEKSDTYSSSPQVDLLSGEGNYSGSVPQSMTEISLHGSSLNLCADHNEEAADSQSISVQVKIPTKMGVAQYISCFDLLTASLGDNKLGFVEAMELEIERLRLDISAPERDKALSSIGIDPATINPNALLEESHMVSLSKAANSLALLAQAFSEDRTTSAIGLDPVHDEIDIDFWNINRIGEECCGDPCQVRVEPSTLTSSSQSIFSCSACQRKACRVCCAGKGAILLVRNQSGGTGTASGGDSASNRSVTMDGVICKLCCQQSVLDALTLDYIRVLISQRRSIRIETASFDALGQVVGKNYFSRKKESSDNHADVETRRELLNEEESLAEFPFGSFLHSVESASGSAPALSLLAPLDTGSHQSYWKAPPSTSSVEFIIVLGNHSDVSGVVLLVSPCGYSMSDSPTVQIWTSQKIHKEERSCVGKWDVRSLITSSPELSGPEKPGNTPRHIKFRFQNRVRCRLIWINLSIQQTAGSDSVSFEKDSNLLSLDEDPSSSDDLGRRAPIAETSETDPCLHAKRILVVGYSVKADIADSSSQNSERASSLKNWLEKPPLTNRYRVQVDSEKLIENDLVLEQLVSQGSPMVAGFRLDGFSAIKPRVTHSPYRNINSLDASSIVFEHRFISPPVLHIQVSTLQVNDCYDNVCYQGSSEEMVVVGEFRIPEVKGGTTMYFDLPKAISGRRIWFRVVGDVAGFADDPEEGEAGRPVAAGLSLLNRIKLFYYAHPNDLGRWASLSGI